jgi:hypothetical protein
MIIASISPREDRRTITGLRMRLEFEQILTATVSSSANNSNSARPQDTGSTGLGQVNTQSPNTTTLSQYQVTDTSGVDGTIPGSGSISSVNVNSLQNLSPGLG